MWWDLNPINRKIVCFFICLYYRFFVQLDVGFKYSNSIMIDFTDEIYK